MSDLIVHQLPGAWGLPSISPFCLKLDAYLRIAGVPFQTVVDATPFKGPKGKLPWIEHDGRRIGDSGFVIEYVESQFGCVPNRDLSPTERSVARAMRRLIEENLYWTMVYDRWMVDEKGTSRIFAREVIAWIQPHAYQYARSAPVEYARYARWGRARVVLRCARRTQRRRER